MFFLVHNRLNGYCHSQLCWYLRGIKFKTISKLDDFAPKAKYNDATMHCNSEFYEYVFTLPQESYLMFMLKMEVIKSEVAGFSTERRVCWLNVETSSSQVNCLIHLGLHLQLASLLTCFRKKCPTDTSAAFHFWFVWINFTKG